jgi:capsular polysaccharide transport system ATP-binding protein
MIRLANISKHYSTSSGIVKVLDGVNFEVARGESVGILGYNGAGKSTLIRIISGAEMPDAGVVDRQMSVSWPLAFSGAFQTSLTGIDNLRFICRVYGVDTEQHIPFVQEFSELGVYLNEPMRTYSSGMTARLAFALSMVVEFDCFLIDEIVAVGDSRFQEKCHEELFVKRADRARIIVSHNADYIRDHCNRAAVLRAGKLYPFDSVNAAYGFYTERLS